jgi:hypothetical protein
LSTSQLSEQVEQNRRSGAWLSHDEDRPGDRLRRYRGILLAPLDDLQSDRQRADDVQNCNLDAKIVEPGLGSQAIA